MGVYNPPDLTTISEFHNDFLDFDNLRLKYRNLVILGDFNIHINNTDSGDAHQFLHTIEAIGLKQKVEYPTHIKGNILDLIFMDEFEADYKFKDIDIGDLILDHYLISLVLNIKDNDSTLCFKNFRNFKRANVEEMIRDMNLWDYNGNSLDEVTTSFNNNVQKALDKHALEKRVKLSLKKSEPWYDDDLRHLHREVRRREMIWRKYQEEHQWLAFKEKQNKYINQPIVNIIVVKLH